MDRIRTSRIKELIAKAKYFKVKSERRGFVASDII